MIDPVAVELGPLKIHWYGIMYLVGFATAWWLGTVRARPAASGWQAEEIGDLIFYAALGVVLGGRLGYMLFYDMASLIADPSSLIKIWQGGMSFHGGLLGVITAMWLYGRKTKRHFLQVADFVAPLVPIGLGAGRIGNFINGELWGKVSGLPWAIVFPDPRAGALPRHPSPLYEALLEGALLFVILWIFSRRSRPIGAVSGLFLTCYGLFRFLVEFVRMPDAQIGYLALDWVTMGQVLSVPMIAAGVWLMFRACRGAMRTNSRSA